jgi:D-3-phosphoglycerate dehydrogenase
MTHRILVLEEVDPKGVDLLRSREEFQVNVQTELSREELVAAVGDYDALVVGSDTVVDKVLLRAAPQLKAIGIAGAEVSNVDVPEATRAGIAVLSAPDGTAVATAEHTIAVLMALHRHIPQATASMKEGKWEKKKFQGREMAGRTLGVIGLGRVGKVVSQLASRGLRMNVLVYSPHATVETAAHAGAKLVILDRLFAQSDAITIHAPLNRETKGLLDARAFDQMRPGVLIVNCAAAEIVNERALLEALDTGKVSGAAIDVFPMEPASDDPLAMHPRVIATPHLGGSTAEADRNLALAVAEQLIDYLEEGIARGAVNLPAVEAPERSRMRPYLDLARRLAAVLAWLAPAAVTAMEVEYRGEVATWNLQPMTNAALVGLLTRFEGPDVNEVNAPVIAKERGIRVSQTTFKAGLDYASSIAIGMRFSDGSSRTLEGALVQRVGFEPRIIGIDRFITEAVPAGPMLVVTNRDIPGMIAGMTTVLANRGINIAQMNLSRQSVHGMALSIINLDEPADEAALAEIRSIEGILSVQQVILDQ